MENIKLNIADFSLPEILFVEKDFIIAYKPPNLQTSNPDLPDKPSLVNFCAEKFPSILTIPKTGFTDNGIIHRVDYETHGLVLLCRTIEGFNSIWNAQKEIKFWKGYTAITTNRENPALPFPPFPGFCDDRKTILGGLRRSFTNSRMVEPIVEESSVEGKKRRNFTTRIVSERKTIYPVSMLRANIVAGYRHQVRCHLAWAGRPIVNDRLYGTYIMGKGLLALRATALGFPMPATGELLRFSIPELSPREL